MIAIAIISLGVASKQMFSFPRLLQRPNSYRVRIPHSLIHNYFKIATLSYAYFKIVWRRVGDSNSRARFPQPNGLAIHPLQPLG